MIALARTPVHIHIVDAFYAMVVFFILCLPFSGNNSPIKALYQLVFFIGGVVGFCIALRLAFQSVGVRRDVALLFLIFLGLVVVSGAGNINAFSLSSFADYLGFFLSVSLTFLVAYTINSPLRKRFIYVLLFILVVLNFVFGVIQLVLGKDVIFGNPPISGRISGLFSWGAPVVGSYAGLVFPIAVYFYINRKIRLSFALLFFAVVVALGGNRSMLIVDFITLFLLLLLHRSHRPYALKFILGVVLILIITLPLLIVFLQDYISSNLMYRLTSLGGGIWEEQKTKRIATWVQTMCLIQDYPLFGVGFGNYKAAMLEYLHCAPISEGQMPHPHHVYFDLLSSVGMVGTLSLAIIVIYLMCQSRKIIPNESVRIENYLILLIIFSPLNVTHGFVSNWWSVMCFIMIGVVLSNIFYAGSWSKERAYKSGNYC